MSMNKKEGFTFLEIMGGIFILTVGIVAVANLVANLFLYQRFLSAKLTASYLTQEGLEMVREVRDTNWLRSKKTGAGIVGNQWDANIFCCLLDPDLGCSGDCACVTADHSPGTSCRVSYDDVLATGVLELSESTDGRLYRDADGFFTHDPSGEPTKFRRFISVRESMADPHIMKVCVTTIWEAQVTDWTREHEVKACEKLYNWYYRGLDEE